MKLAVYSCREDEKPLFDYFADKYKIEIKCTSDMATLKNADLAQGCSAISVITKPVTKDLLDIWHEYGVKVISTRTVGFEHVDYEYARTLGMVVSNVSYTPHTVAEYTIMTMLMAIRKMKTIMTRYTGQDYSLLNVRGKELGNMTVGVIGTGQIGTQVIKKLSGFGCRILAYNPHEREEVKKYADYVDMETLYRESDLITLHTPANSDTHHMINKKSIEKMKNQVVLINMARGSLVDTAALIEGLEQGKISAAALDVLEKESAIYYKDFKYKPVCHHEMAVLHAMPNVLMTPHIAFFTDEAVSDMIEYSITSCIATVKGEKNPFQVN